MMLVSSAMSIHFPVLARPVTAKPASIVVFPLKKTESVCTDPATGVDGEKREPGGNAGSDDSAEDGTDDDGGNPEPEKRAVQGNRTSTVVHPRYLKSSGVRIEIPGGARIGQRAVTVLQRNATL
ncbi:hypothetical protein GTA08_BOTSDO02376 [Botryosphaeria dothidea]|uniref:Uncharacterized protein n=1 Tax=Botryosphaeria dothidea TaxID=55169 RepID=A0A8H4N513_9PEZI|nr:hypothetical protein GTA08_BOTSDO02376 [Botryosphaeria dothidea]